MAGGFHEFITTFPFLCIAGLGDESESSIDEYPSLIEPNFLYLGGQETANQNVSKFFESLSILFILFTLPRYFTYKVIDTLKIHHVLNMAEECKYTLKNCTKYDLPLRDFDHVDILKFFTKTNEIIGTLFFFFFFLFPPPTTDFV
eukprot:TRINITY_DN14817_c0_g1_i6.p1 TRINITY_DN14817_c0_g1~~TRINITY_DN14817_c0_g1_i6.p1  ORF type:complete len:145 (+),score=25.61 TRINITY_DN14817_c0_g1_i6:436-870(+)